MTVCLTGSLKRWTTSRTADHENFFAIRSRSCRRLSFGMDGVVCSSVCQPRRRFGFHTLLRVSEVGVDFQWRGVADVHLAFQHRRFFAASSIVGHLPEKVWLAPS